MDHSSEKATSWWTITVQGLKEDLRLRRLLIPMRKADMHSTIKKEDKIHIKTNIFISAFVLFNASLATLYLSLKSKQTMKTITVPAALGLFGLLAYKLELEWFSREVIRKCELSSSDTAYFMRKKLLAEFGEHPFVKTRSRIFQTKNKQYERLYIVK